MKSFIFIGLLNFLVFSSQAQIMWTVKKDTSEKWYLQFNDEFNANQLDESNWRSGYPWGTVIMNLDLIYKRDNLLFKNGLVEMVAKKEKTVAKVNEWDIDKNYLKKYNKSIIGNNEYEFDISSGAISSNRKFKYGFFEIRFKANNEKGVWPAFWLFGGEPNDEIDFYEGKGERGNQVHIDVHCPTGCDDYRGGFLNLKKNFGAWVKADQSLADGWNIISGEWQPNYVKFFLNGNPIGYFEGEFKSSQYLIVNSAVAKDKEAFKPGPDASTNWPNSFFVDYVRVWSKSDTVDFNRDNYLPYEHTPNTILNNNLYDAKPDGKVKFVYNKKVLSSELGTITMLPILYNKYSLSVQGLGLTKMQVDVYDRFDKKVAGFGLDNVEYYIMDLSALPTGPYKVKIQVANQVLEHDIPVINPEKVGEHEK